MPIATRLPARNVTLRFPDQKDVDESYQLLELPAEILKQVEGGKAASFALTIKGRPSDDAVLCTPTSTFQLRTITLSNSQLICRQRPSDDLLSQQQTLELRDVAHEVLECVPCAPNLGRIKTMLRDSAWEGSGAKRRKVSGKRWTRGQLESVIQASEAELSRGLRERNVIDVQGRMMLLPAKPLRELLVLIVTIHEGHATEAGCDADLLRRLLVDDHDTDEAVVDGVLDLFGEIKEGVWVGDGPRVVREIGKGILESLPAAGLPVDSFAAQWKEEAGERWADAAELSLLEGEYLLEDPPASLLRAQSRIIKYFPLHLLPLAPPLRFSDLFLTRPKWRPEEMTPFLRGLTRDGDKKELDKLVVKFVRVVKEKDGVWWHPRRTG